LYEGYKSLYTRNKTTRWSRWFIAGAVLIFVAYSAILVALPYLWFKKERLHGANVINSKKLPSVAKIHAVNFFPSAHKASYQVRAEVLWPH
jgi:multisubunit Na+/H+ antiporter MnhB subunit